MSRFLLVFLFFSLPLSGSAGLEGPFSSKSNVALCAFQTLNQSEVITEAAKPIRKVTYVRARWSDWQSNRAFVFDEGDEVQVLKLGQTGPLNQVLYVTLKPLEGVKGEDLEAYYQNASLATVSEANASAPAGWEHDKKNTSAVLEHNAISAPGISCDEKCLRLVMIDRQTTDAEALMACQKLL